MRWLHSYSTNGASDTPSGSESDPRTAYDEPKTSEQLYDSSLTARPPSPWAIPPVRHPFQLATTANRYSTAPPSITSDAPLHPTSHLDLIPTPTTVAMPSQTLTDKDIIPERRPPSRISYRPRPAHHSWIVSNKILSLVIALPSPTILSIIYMVVGHAILRAARSHSSYELVALSSSAKAGAVGGAILTLPIILLLYAVQHMCMDSSNDSSDSSGPDDFFDDESDAGDKAVWRRLRRVLACVLLGAMAMFIGTMASPIGVSILKSSSSTLSAAQATAGATVGGALFFPVVILLCVIL